MLMRRIAVFTTAVVTFFAVVALVAGGWFYSSEILAVPVAGEYSSSLTITDVDPAAETVTLDTLNSEAVTLDTVGLITERGNVVLSGTPRFFDTTVERRATLISGEWPQSGDAAAVSVDMYVGDPQDTLDLPFDEVQIAGELGSMPAWQIIPDGADTHTWVILVHGRGAHRPSNNRYVPALYDLGLPTLNISIRNGPGAAEDPQGYGRFGYSEWHDLDAAVSYLRDTFAAQRLILVGSSQGASVSLMFMRQSAYADMVDGMVLISPLISLDATLYLAAEQRGIPRPLIRPLLTSAKIVTRLRSGMVFSELEHQKHVDAYPADLPILLTHGNRDLTVPFAPTPPFAAALGPRAVFVHYVDIDHVREWNSDPERFDRDLRQFIVGDVLGDALEQAS